MNPYYNQNDRSENIEVLQPSETYQQAPRKSIYEHVMEFKNKYPKTVTWWRLKKHCDIIDKHINSDEYVIYAFAGQKNDEWYDLFTTAVFALTNRRLLIAQKRVVFGYYLNSISPKLFNDMQVYQGLFWGRVTIDTSKELVIITNLDKRSLDEVETQVTEVMTTLKNQIKEIESNMPDEE